MKMVAWVVLYRIFLLRFETFALFLLFWSIPTLVLGRSRESRFHSCKVIQSFREDHPPLLSPATQHNWRWRGFSLQASAVWPYTSHPHQNWSLKTTGTGHLVIYTTPPTQHWYRAVVLLQHPPHSAAIDDGGPTVSPRCQWQLAIVVRTRTIENQNNWEPEQSGIIHGFLQRWAIVS